MNKEGTISEGKEKEGRGQERGRWRKEGKKELRGNEGGETQ